MTQRDQLTDLSNTAQREQFWLRHLRAAMTQSTTLSHYAASEGLKLHQLYAWKRTLRRRGLLDDGTKPSSGFVPVVSPSPTDTIASPSLVPACTLSFANGTRLDFNAPLSAEQLSALLGALGVQL